MDAIQRLLSSDVPGEAIHWIMPRQSYVLNRAFQEKGGPGLKLMYLKLSECATEQEALQALEEISCLVRVDTSREATCFRFAVLSDAELEEMRKVQDIIMLGHVQQVTADSIVMQKGTIQMVAGALLVDCTANGNGTGSASIASEPIWSDTSITLQTCVPSEPWAAYPNFVNTQAWAETHLDTDERKNRLCIPLPGDSTPKSFLAFLYINGMFCSQWKTAGIYEGWHRSTVQRGFSCFPDDDSEAVSAHAKAMRQLAKIIKK